MLNSNTMNRRELFDWGLNGLGATAMLSMLQQDGLIHAADAAKPAYHAFEPRAKRAVHICLVGGMSHLDSFDYKPELEKMHGKSLKYDKKPDIFFGKVGQLRKNDWEFKPRGESGLMISELFPNVAKQADDLCLLKSMVSNSANHTPALFVENSGFEFNGFPAMGSWLSFGLGSETNDLPSYVVLPDGRGGPNGGATNWSNGFLPVEYQGVVLRGGKQPVRDLFPPKAIKAEVDQATRKFVDAINKGHLERVGVDPVLAARIRSYELAARMQLSIPEVSNLSSETEATQTDYGIKDKTTEDMGTRCLLGRRLLERGVRFVQIYSGGPIAGSPRASWDAHESVLQNHGFEAGRIDKPIAALLKDLKQRGMLKDTLVLFTTEFGRTPGSQGSDGRDHHIFGFSVWMAGGGLKRGVVHGATDEIGFHAVENRHYVTDIHATILKQLGLESRQLEIPGRKRLEIDHGHPIDEIIA